MGHNMLFSRKRIKSKKGDVGQVFIYILTILIMGLMLYFGVKWIVGLVTTQCDIGVAQMKIDLETSFEKKRPNTGSWENVEFYVPGCLNLKKVCFLDQSYQVINRPDSGLCKLGEKDYNPMMCYAWNTEENILFDPPVSVSIYVKDIKVDSSVGYKCFPIEDNKFKVKLTGLGVSVRVS
jgi:hypothetical protein